MLRYYHYRKLSSVSQEAYKKIVAAIKRFSLCAVIDRVENLQVVVNAVKNDNPHLFYVNWYSYRAEYQGAKIIIYFQYHMGRGETLAVWRNAKATAPSLRGSTDYQSIKNVHDYIAKNTRYDKAVTDKNGFRMNDHTMIGPLFEGLGVCEGISRAAQFLLRELRVECTYQNGYVNENGARGYHAWNLVRVNGETLKMDVTWDLADRNGRVSYRYFCVKP